MSLQPSASVTLGRQRFDTHAVGVEVELGLLPAVDTARVLLPTRVEMSAEPGDDASLDLDGGEGAKTVLTGRVRSIRRGLRGVEVVLAGGAADLGALRPAATYDRRGAADVIRALARDAGVDVGAVEVDLPLASYVAWQSRTAAEHVAALARLGGAVARFSADGSLEVTAWPTTGPDAMLKHGRELVDYAVARRPGPAAARVAVGHGPAGTVEAPDALRQSADPLPSGVPDPGADAVWTPTPVLRTPQAAMSASQAIDREFRAGDVQLRARCFLLPGLRAGHTIRCAELPDGLDGGPWLLDRVVHRLDERGGETRLWGRSLSAASAGGLLGAALGALGGLL